MWLDRFSNQSAQPAPQTQARQYSPSPRRPSHLGGIPGRPAFSPRSSSLSLPLAFSSSSTAASAKPSNASALRQSTVASTPENVPDPLDVLNQILGHPIPSAEGTLAEISRPSAFEDVEFGDLSIQEFATSEASLLSRYGNMNGRAVDDYEGQAAKFEELHRSVTACDEVLNSVETYLTSFRTDLGNVSSEIELLQNRSTALNRRLENRKQVEKLLGPAVEEISISRAVVKKISEGSIDEAWEGALHDVQQKFNIVEARLKNGEPTKAMQDIQPILRSLIDKALERTRDYFVAQIKALRSPNINAQILQRQNFLRFKQLFSILSKFHPKLGEQIGQAYINTMRWYYFNAFQRYETALGKVKLHIIDRSEAIGTDDSARKAAVLGPGKAAGPLHDAYGIGRRMDLLKSNSRLALSSYLAEEDKGTHFLEVPFRSFNLALVDNACNEYTFLSDFFSHSSFHQISRMFAQIFGPTCNIGQNLTKTLVESTVDCLGILLCVRLNQCFAFDLQRRKVPTLDSYINGINMLLWPRFQMVMDVHCESLKKASAVSHAGNATPHPATQKFAQLLQGISELSSEAGDDEPIASSLTRLRNEFESFLTRASKAIGDVRKRKRFLFNNFQLILTILGDTEGKLAQDQRDHFKKAASDNNDG